MLVHASLRQIEPDRGGASTVLSALRDVLGRRGTVVVPAQTSWNSRTSRAFRTVTEGMSALRLNAYLDELPVFQPKTTPSSGMGALAEHVRTRRKAVRSAHPQTSFAAVGPLARRLMGVHDRDCLLGERSPLGALYEADARVLHLGTGFETATIFHLGEWRAAPSLRAYSCKIAGVPENGGWVEFKDVDYNDADFDLIGASFEEKTGSVRRGTAGSAPSLLYPARDAADYAEHWVRHERRQTVGLSDG